MQPGASPASPGLCHAEASGAGGCWDRAEASSPSSPPGGVGADSAGGALSTSSKDGPLECQEDVFQGSSAAFDRTQHDATPKDERQRQLGLDCRYEETISLDGEYGDSTATKGEKTEEKARFGCNITERARSDRFTSKEDMVNLESRRDGKVESEGRVSEAIRRNHIATGDKLNIIIPTLDFTNADRNIKSVKADKSYKNVIKYGFYSPSNEAVLRKDETKKEDNSRGYSPITTARILTEGTPDLSKHRKRLYRNDETQLCSLGSGNPDGKSSLFSRKAKRPQAITDSFAGNGGTKDLGSRSKFKNMLIDNEDIKNKKSKTKSVAGNIASAIATELKTVSEVDEHVETYSSLPLNNSVECVFKHNNSDVAKSYDKSVEYDYLHNPMKISASLGNNSCNAESNGNISRSNLYSEKEMCKNEVLGSADINDVQIIQEVGDKISVCSDRDISLPSKDLEVSSGCLNVDSSFPKSKFLHGRILSKRQSFIGKSSYSSQDNFLSPTISNCNTDLIQNNSSYPSANIASDIVIPTKYLRCHETRADELNSNTDYNKYGVDNIFKISENKTNENIRDSDNKQNDQVSKDIVDDNYDENYPKIIGMIDKFGTKTKKFDKGDLAYIREITEVSVETEMTTTIPEHTSSNTEVYPLCSFNINSSYPTSNNHGFVDQNGENGDINCVLLQRYCPSLNAENGAISSGKGIEDNSYELDGSVYYNCKDNINFNNVIYKKNSEDRTVCEINRNERSTGSENGTCVTASFCDISRGDNELNNREDNIINQEYVKNDNKGRECFLKFSEKLICPKHEKICENFCTTCCIPVCANCEEPYNHAVVSIGLYITSLIGPELYERYCSIFKETDHTFESIAKLTVRNLESLMETLQTDAQDARISFNELEQKYKFDQQDSIYDNDINHIHNCINLMEDIPQLTTNNNEEVLGRLLCRLASHIPVIQTNIGKQLVSLARKAIRERLNSRQNVKNMKELVEQIKNIVTLNKSKMKDEIIGIMREKRRLLTRLRIYPRVIEAVKYKIFYLNKLLESEIRIPTPFAVCFLGCNWRRYLHFYPIKPNCENLKYYEAYEGARYLPFVQESLFAKTHDCGDGLFVTEPIDIDFDVSDAIEINCRMSPKGVLAQSILRDIHMIVLTDLSTTQSVSIDIMRSSIAFYDDLVILFPIRKTHLLEAKIDEVFEKPVIETFKIVEIGIGILSVDSSCTPSTGKAFIRSDVNTLIEYDVRTRKTTAIGRCSGNLIFTSGVRYADAFTMYSIQNNEECSIIGISPSGECEIMESEYEGNTLIQLLGNDTTLTVNDRNRKDTSINAIDTRTPNDSRTSFLNVSHGGYKDYKNTQNISHDTELDNIDHILLINLLGDVIHNGKYINIPGVSFWQGQNVLRLYQNVFIFVNKITYSWQCLRIELKNNIQGRIGSSNSSRMDSECIIENGDKLAMKTIPGFSENIDNGEENR